MPEIVPFPAKTETKGNGDMPRRSLWEIGILAPNGLACTVLVDEMVVRHSYQPIEAILEPLRQKLIDLYDRRNEVNPNV